MANTYPALEVSFAPGVASSAVPTALQWVNITSYVASLDGKYGKEDEFSEPSAGSLELVLNNSGGRFDPDNASGPYYGQLLPLVWFRVKGGTTTANTDVFYGQVSIEGWRLEASQFPDSTVRVTVVDMFEQLANTNLPGSVYEVEVKADAPEAWWRLGEQSGNVAVDSSGNQHHGSYEGLGTFNSRTGLIANDDNNAMLIDPFRMTLPVGSQVRSDWDFTIEGWVDVPDSVTYDGTIWRQSTQSDTSFTGTAHNIFVGFRAMGAEAYPYVEILVNSPAAGSTTYVQATSPLSAGIHHIVAYIPAAGASLPAGIKLYVDGAVVASSSGGDMLVMPSWPTVPAINNTDMGSDATLDEVAVYDGELSAARVAAHYTAGAEPWGSELTSTRITHLLDAVAFPATLRTIGTGDTTMPAADLNTDTLSALQAAAKAERGDLYVDHHDGGKLRFRGRHAKWTEARSVTSQATFGDSGAEVTYSGIDIQDDRIVNYAAVQRTGGATIVARDSASETQYQRRTLSETGLLFETDAEAQGRAELIVAEKKDRHRRVRSITLEPAKSTHSAWAQVFAREIGDRITVKWRPAYGGTYSYDSWIIGVAFSWRPRDSKPWRTVYFLAPVPYGATGAPYFILDTSTLDSGRLGY